MSGIGLTPEERLKLIASGLLTLPDPSGLVGPGFNKTRMRRRAESAEPTIAEKRAMTPPRCRKHGCMEPCVLYTSSTTGEQYYGRQCRCHAKEAADYMRGLKAGIIERQRTRVVLSMKPNGEPGLK